MFKYVGVAVGVLVLAAASLSEAKPYRAEITRTAYGIPHVQAKDWGSIGFGEAYAYLEDNLCLLADKIVTVNGERSRWFGAEGSSVIAFADTPNLDSDAFFKAILDVPKLRAAFGKASPEYQAMVRGYVAGFNHYLAQHPVASLPTQCQGGWVRPITLDDILKLNEEKSIQASAGAWLKQIVAAKPPGATNALVTAGAASGPGFPVDPEGGGLGSNGWAFGKDATANGRGLLLGNPHFPWEGTNRFYEMHLTLPGKLDVMGVTIGGSPGMSIGFNKDVGWTHTVSTDRHFTLFELKLDPADPTRYLVDGVSEPMTKKTVSIAVKGEAAPREHTFWFTRYGPVGAAPQQGFGWTATTAYALKDANSLNFRGGDFWLDVARARNVGEVRAALIKTLGSPWVNTIAADRDGNALYADITATPDVTAAKQKSCAPASGKGALAATLRVYILDGSRSACDWDKDSAAAVPGLMAGAAMPALVRTDYVANSNDSFWLANPRAPQAPQPPIVGSTGTVLNLRTRSGIQEIEARLAGADGLPGKSFDHKAVEVVLYRNKNLAAELVLDDVKAVCAGGASGVTASGQTVDLAKACAVLAAWDRRMDLASVGPQLFIEFWKDAENIPGVWTTPFDPKDPVNTPRGVKASDPTTATALRKALAEAVTRLEAAHIPIDRPWGEVQLATRGGLNIPVHGGEGPDGVLNAQQSKLIPGVGYVPYHGSSYIQVVGFDDKGPVVDAILTYSQSTDPASPHFADQTRLHAEKRWVRLPFSKAEISSDPSATREVVSEECGHVLSSGLRAMTVLGAAPLIAIRASKLVDWRSLFGKPALDLRAGGATYCRWPGVDESWASPLLRMARQSPIDFQADKGGEYAQDGDQAEAVVDQFAHRLAAPRFRYRHGLADEPS